MVSRLSEQESEMRKKALIVVDYQHDFVDGALGFSQAKTLEQPIAAKIAEYHNSGNDVFFTLDTHDDRYLQTQQGSNLPIVHCMKDTSGWSLFGAVGAAKRDCDHFFLKSAYGSAKLFSYLQTKEYQSIELVGILSNICVISNAVLAQTALPEAAIIIDKNCIASNSETLHSASLAVMEGLHMKIIPSQ